MSIAATWLAEAAARRKPAPDPEPPKRLTPYQCRAHDARRRPCLGTPERVGLCRRCWKGIERRAHGRQE